jgi:hypothetical protein
VRGEITMRCIETEELSTAAVAADLGINPGQVLAALDAGLLAGHVRLSAGRPVFRRSAVARLEGIARSALLAG